MHRGGRTLCLLTTFVCLVHGTASWGQTYNPTKSNLVNLNTAGGTGTVAESSGYGNTAFGVWGLYNNTDGIWNTAQGTLPLFFNTTGSWNIATGGYALYSNTIGSGNTATGGQALFDNISGNNNTATGGWSLFSNITGIRNTATGVQSLQSNTTGFANTADGIESLYTNLTGFRNTAVGGQALMASTGNNNTALGYAAGNLLTSGSNNVYLSHPGVATESNTQRLGNTQTRTFIAGIKGVPVTGATVTVNAQGQIGILASSERYKKDIAPMATQSADIYKLRPVTYHYKADEQQQTQYGLIAEEVAKVYPEIVVKDATGQIESLQYNALIPMLLNEVQHQQHELAELKAQNAHLQATLVQQNAALAARLEQLEAGVARATTLATR